MRETIEGQEGDWAVRMSELRQIAAEMAHREVSCMPDNHRSKQSNDCKWPSGKRSWNGNDRLRLIRKHSRTRDANSSNNRAR